MNFIRSSFLALGMVVTVAAQAGEGPSNFEIVSLSNRTDLVSGATRCSRCAYPRTCR